MGTHPLNESPASSETLSAWLNQLADRIIQGEPISRENALALTKLKAPTTLSNCVKPLTAFVKPVVVRSWTCAVLSMLSRAIAQRIVIFVLSQLIIQGKGPPFMGSNPRQKFWLKRSRCSRRSQTFCLVSQGRGPKYQSPKSSEFAEVLEIVRQIIAQTNIQPCCALGEVTVEQAQALKRLG